MASQGLGLLRLRSTIISSLAVKEFTGGERDTPQRFGPDPCLARQSCPRYESLGPNLASANRTMMDGIRVEANVQRRSSTHGPIPREPPLAAPRNTLRILPKLGRPVGDAAWSGGPIAC